MIRNFLFIVLCCLGTLSVSGQYLPQRDLSFGDEGEVILDVDALDHCSAVVIDSLGNTYFCGYTGTVTNGIEYDYVAGKLLPDGTLDSSFGDQGILRGDFYGFTSSEFVDLALLSDGIALLGNGGHHSSIDSQYVYVLKVDFNGQPDLSFGEQGLYEGHYRGMLNDGHAIEALEGDQLLIAGATYDSAYSHKETGFIGRLLAHGQHDTTFGGSGILTWDGLNGLQSAMSTDLPTNRHSDGSTFLDIAVTPWGDYFAVGFYDSGIETLNLVARFRPDGTFAPGFGFGNLYVYSMGTGANQQITSCTMVNDELMMGLFLQDEHRFVLQSIDSSGALSPLVYAELNGTVTRVHDLYAEDETLFFCGEARESANNDPGYSSDYFTLGAMKGNLQADTTFTSNGFFTDHFGTGDEAGSHALAGGPSGLVLAGQLNADFSTGNYEDFAFIRLKTAAVSTVSLQDLAMEKNRLVAYPNPTTAVVTVEPHEDATMIEVLDAQGRLLQQIDWSAHHSLQLDFSEYPTGIYWLRSIASNGIQVERIIRQ